MYTYLLVDDEALTRKGTIKKLEGLADRITCIAEAENGSQALEKIKEFDPDIIITDMNMPIMDGTQFLSILSKEYPQKQVLVISSYKDFEYMHQAIKANAIDYILKPFGKEDIEKCILRAIEQLETNTSIEQQIVSMNSQKEAAQYEYDIQSLRNILLGFDIASTKLLSQKLSYINQTHKFMLITIHSSEDLAAIDIQNYLSENGFGDLAVFFQNNATPHIGFLILFVSDDPMVNEEKYCKQILRNLIYRYDSELDVLSFGVSNLHSDISKLHTAYHETIDSLNTKLVSDNFCYYFYHTKEEISEKVYWDKQEEFLFRLELGMTTEINVLIEELFKMFISTNAQIGTIKYFYLQLAKLAQEILSEYVEQVTPDTSSLSIKNILNTLFTLEELKEYYLLFFSNISNLLKDCTVYADNDTVDKVCIYMQKNYRNNLSLEFISSLLYVNRSYLSRVFKNKTGETFVDYLNNIRIEHAKELLCTTDKKMYAIAKLVGYDNVKYFFRVFKKKMGCTPEQYRKEH